MNILFTRVYQQKNKQIPSLTLQEKFSELRAIFRLIMFPFGIMLLVIYVIGSSGWLIPYEFPYFKTSEIVPITIPIYMVFSYLLSISLPTLLGLNNYNRATKILANTILPILESEFENREPLIRIWTFKNEIGLKSVNMAFFMEVLGIASKIAEKKETIHFGVLRNHIYLIEPLIKTIEENIRQKGQADINEIATETHSNPKILRLACIKLKKRKILKNVTITPKRIKTINQNQKSNNP